METYVIQRVKNCKHDWENNFCGFLFFGLFWTSIILTIKKKLQKWVHCPQEEGLTVICDVSAHSECK